MKILIFVMILLFSNLGLADEFNKEILEVCKKRVNLARKNWVVRTDVPVLDQGPVRMCYAHAASTYLDVWRAWNAKKPTKVWAISSILSCDSGVTKKHIKIGTNVIAQFYDEGSKDVMERWFKGEVQDVKNEKYLIKYFDGMKKWIHLCRIIPYNITKKTIETNDLVYATWNDQGPKDATQRYYKGIIQKVEGSNVLIKYYDGMTKWRPNTKVYSGVFPKTSGGSILGNIKLKQKMGLSSPYWIGYLAKISEKAQTGKNPANLDNGSGELALDVIVRGLDNMCREDVLKKSLMNYSEGDLITLPEFYTFTAWFFDKYNDGIQAKLTRSGISASRACRKKNNVRDEIKCSKYKKELKKVLFDFYDANKPKSITGQKIINSFMGKVKVHKLWPSMKTALKNKRKNYLSFFYKVFYKCQIKGNKYRELNPDIMKNYDVCSVKKDNKTINSLLDHLNRKIPVALNYYVDFLTTKDFSTKKNRLHQSVIIGNRVRDKQCQFLLQNSWGNYCKSKSYRWECQKDKAGNEMGVWINAHSLLKATESIYYIESKKIGCPKKPTD